MIEIYANMYSYKGKHYIKDKKRYMELDGYTFVWDADAEIWFLEG